MEEEESLVILSLELEDASNLPVSRTLALMHETVFVEKENSDLPFFGFKKSNYVISDTL